MDEDTLQSSTILSPIGDSRSVVDDHGDGNSRNRHTPMSKSNQQGVWEEDIKVKDAQDRFGHGPRWIGLYEGTTLGAIAGNWGAALVADGFQFFDKKQVSLGEQIPIEEVPDGEEDIAPVVAEDIMENFRLFSRSYTVTSGEAGEVQAAFANRQKYYLVNTDANKIHSAGSDSCEELSGVELSHEIGNNSYAAAVNAHSLGDGHIIAAIKGVDVVGKKIIGQLNDMATRLKSRGEKLVLKHCVDHTATFLDQTFKPEDWDLPEGYNMDTYTCGLMFITCESNEEKSKLIPKFAYVDKLIKLDNVEDFLFVGQGYIFANKVLRRHWRIDMEQMDAVARLKEGAQAASFSLLSGGVLSIVSMSIDDLWFKTIKASAEFKAGNIPWSKYGDDLYNGNHTAVWGSWWNNGNWGYKCCKRTEKNCSCVPEHMPGEPEDLIGPLPFIGPQPHFMATD